MTRLETLAGNHQQELEDMRRSHTQRMDDLQAEIVQLQKFSSEPPSAQASPVGSPSYRAAGPFDEPCFDLVLGVWREGRSSESVQHDINSMLDSAELAAQVSELKMFGKRPTIAKLILKLPATMTTQEKRDRQLIFRDSFRKTLEGKGLWCNLDKPPKMRAVSKAVGRLSGFLQGPLKMSKDQLEVGSWPQAKCFVGDFLLTGLIGSPGAKPPKNPSHLRWLIQDDSSTTRIWIDLHSLALATKDPFEDLTKMWELHFGPGGPGGEREQ